MAVKKNGRYRGKLSPGLNTRFMLGVENKRADWRGRGRPNPCHRTKPSSANENRDFFFLLFS